MATRQKTVKEATEKQGSSEIQSPKGKLGIMIPGMGAVATTFVAGVEAIRKGLAKPIGSLTQMGTIRLGKRTDGRSPKIKEFVPARRPERSGLHRMGPLRGRHVHRRLESRRAREVFARPDQAVSQHGKAAQGRLRPQLRQDARRQATSKRARTRWTWPSRFAPTSASSARVRAQAAWSPSGADRPRSF